MPLAQAMPVARTTGARRGPAPPAAAPTRPAAGPCYYLAVSVLSIAALGLVVGLRHALEPDHLAAVSTLVSDGASWRRGAVLGALWGVGHTAAILAAVVVLALLGAAMPPAVASALEAGVGVMLIVLGALAVRRASRLASTGPARPHTHGALRHVHPAGAAHVHTLGLALAWRPLLIGAVHGLAGTGTLVSLIAARTSTDGHRVGYMVAFALGATLSMAAASAVGGLLVRATPTRSRRWLDGGLGLTSVLIGGWWLLVSLGG
jgi:hypothetical protein